MHTAVPSAGNSDPEPLQIDIGIKEVAALTTEEKLQHFEDICTGDALKKYEQAVSDYTAYEEKILNEHKENARKQAALQIAAEKERIARETNKNLSLGQIEIRRSYSRKDEELRGKVFSELRDKLARFMETPKYDALLEAQIKKEKAFAGRATCPKKLKRSSISRIYAPSEKSSDKKAAGTIIARIPKGFSSSAAFQQ